MATCKIAVLLILAILIGAYACNGNHKQTGNKHNGPKIRETTLNKNPYPGLRTQAINVTAEQLKLKLQNDNELYGIIMDWNMGDFILTVVSFKTGDASLYLSTGQAYIGGHSRETVHNAAINFISIGKQYLAKAIRTEKIEPAEGEKIDFYFLTRSGRYYVEDEFSRIEDSSSELLGLFKAGDRVITEYRLIDEANRKHNGSN
ncbi:MAG: hypothetical protein DRJ14_02985 [Acidobacteria bacterium]|nr:MAG: hypothetical protein DRJ14_02985 [Acidobacteriota bacterium]